MSCRWQTQMVLLRLHFLKHPWSKRNTRMFCREGYRSGKGCYLHILYLNGEGKEHPSSPEKNERERSQLENNLERVTQETLKEHKAKVVANQWLITAGSRYTCDAVSAPWRLWQIHPTPRDHSSRNQAPLQSSSWAAASQLATPLVSRPLLTRQTACGQPPGRLQQKTRHRASGQQVSGQLRDPSSVYRAERWGVRLGHAKDE